MHVQEDKSNGVCGITIDIANVIKRFPLFSPDPVYMPLKITIAQQLCEDKLFKHRHRTGIKAKPALKVFQQFFRKNHVTYTHGRRNGFLKRY